MATLYKLPTFNEFQRLLMDLIGPNVKVAELPNYQRDGNKAYITATWKNDADEIASFCSLELEISAAIGAALTRIPPPVVKENLQNGCLSEELFGNIAEVMNICTGLMCASHSPHLKQGKVENASSTIAEEWHNLMKAPLAAQHFQLTIGNYGSGVVSFLLVK